MSNIEKQTGTTPETAGQGPVIGIADLQNAVKIIDYACEQGAFKGWQVIEQVISVREKIVAFLSSAVPPEEPVVDAPAPVVDAPAPAVEAPAPAVEAPAPVVKATKVAAKVKAPAKKK